LIDGNEKEASFFLKDRRRIDFQKVKEEDQGNRKF
jgi:hypothetical protein